MNAGGLGGGGLQLHGFLIAKRFGSVVEHVPSMQKVLCSIHSMIAKRFHFIGLFAA